MRNKILLLLSLLSSCALYAQPGQRIKLTQLEQAPVVTGSRQGQIGMSDVAGNQRYTPYVIIADTCTNTPPAPSGNTNISQFVYNCAGDSIWYIDWKGDALLLGGGGAGCDADWLDITSNLCPDDINDSIYTYKYASVGARYAWPLAEFLVNDSTGTAIAVIQGSRNARLGFHDSQNDTWSAINHGGTTTSWYLEDGSELIVTAASGSISIPTIPFTNHFGIRTGDSTLVFYRYPSSRVDTHTVTNILHTDANGVLKSANFANAINNIGFGNVMYHDDTDTGAERVGSWVNRFNGTFISALDSLLANATEGARVEISPGRTTLSSYPSVAKNGKYINILGGTGSYLDVTGTFSYSSPDTVITGGLLLQADTIRFGGALTNAVSTRVMPTGHRIDVRCNTIINSSFSLSKSGYFGLHAHNWTSNTGTYLINPVYTQPKLGDTVTNVQAFIEIDDIRLTGTGNSPRALSYLNSQFDSCSLEYRIGSIKKGPELAAGTGRGFCVHVYSYGSTDTTVVKNSKINTTIGSVSLEGTGASDNPLIIFRPGNPGAGTAYPIYVDNSQINYDLGAVGVSEKLLEVSDLTRFTNSQMKITAGNARVTNDNMIYFQRVTLDSTTIVFEGDYASTSAGNPLIYLDSVTFTNGARIIFRGRYEHQSDGTPVVRLLNMSSAPAGSIIFENATLVAYDTVTIHGTANVTARGLVVNRNPQSTITLQGNIQNAGALRVTDRTATPVTIGAWSTDGTLTQLVPGTNLSISGDSLNAAGGGGGGDGIYGGSGRITEGTVAELDTVNSGLNKPDFILGTRTPFGGVNRRNTFLMLDDPSDPNCWECYAELTVTDSIQKLSNVNEFTPSYMGVNLRNSTTTICDFRLENPVSSGGRVFYISFRNNNILTIDSFANGNVNIKHLSGIPATLSTTIAASAGTGASAALVAAQSSDVAGRFTVTSGTGATTGLWVTITFDDPFKTPPVVQFDCEDANCAGLRWYSNASTTNVELFIASGQADNTSYSFNYHIIQAE